MIQRHRTALVRRELSKPVGMLVGQGLVRSGTSVLDYGCGRGDDVRALVARDVDARGWDPHFAPATPLVTADVVNLGYVMNVIEDVEERHEALQRAWDLTGKVLAVSVMLHGQVVVDGLPTFRDGYVTSRNTFQRYYAQAEVRALIGQITGAQPVSIAPGMFYVFRRSEDEQDFLYERRIDRSPGSCGRRGSAPTSGDTHRATTIRPRRPSLRERIDAEIEEVVDLTLRRGRPPHLDELGEATRLRLANESVSLARVLRMARDAGADDLAVADAAASRREDMIVHHALGLINGNRSATALSSAMDRDVRALFGTRLRLSEAATMYLLALSDTERVEGLCAEVVAQGLGSWDDRRRLVLRDANLPSMPGALRCYVGCASYLSGEPESPFLVRLDPRRRRLKFLLVERERTFFPLVTSSVVVDLRRQDVRVSPEARILVRKSALYGNPSRRQLAAERRRAKEKGSTEGVLFEDLQETWAKVRPGNSRSHVRAPGL